MNGFVDIASNLVKYDTKYRNIVLSLLGTIVVVDNIDNANLISKKLKNRYKEPNTDSFMELAKYNNFIYSKADELVIWTICPKIIKTYRE